MDCCENKILTMKIYALIAESCMAINMYIYLMII